jgi:ribonuclease P protein component
MVFFVMAAEGSENRFGVTASRRVGGAVVRSRCKRRLRELYRLYRYQHEGPPLEIVVNARRDCAEVAWSDLVRDFQWCLSSGVTRVARR